MSIIWTNWFSLSLFTAMVVIFFCYFWLMTREKKSSVTTRKTTLPQSKEHNFDGSKGLQVVIYPCVPARSLDSLISLIQQVDDLVVKWYYQADFLLVEHFEKKKQIGVFTISKLNFEKQLYEPLSTDGSFSCLSLQIFAINEFSQTKTATKMFHLADSLREVYGPDCILYEPTGRPIISKTKIAALVDKTTSW